MKEKLDFIFNKVLPKKFIVITVATVVVFMGIEAPQEYWWLLIAYFTGNAATKFVKKEK
jgi:hypothetical protein